MSTTNAQPQLGLAAFPKLAPGDRIRVTERLVTLDQTWVTQVEGNVISARPETTGSWFAHGKDDKLWLLRVRLRKPDGEISTLNIDQNTEIEILEKKG
jgi:hypothetical protein